MPWTIYWDNGIDCGTWGHLAFDTEEEAEEYANSVTEEFIREGIWEDDGSAEPLWLEPLPSNGESDATVEQSLDYFNRHIAGDR